MNIANADLNLLVVFDVLLRTRSVSGAARALGMSQPAASAALNRVVRQHWHSRFHNDAANRWLRGVVAQLFTERQTKPRGRAGRRLRNQA